MQAHGYFFRHEYSRGSRLDDEEPPSKRRRLGNTIAEELPVATHESFLRRLDSLPERKPEGPFRYNPVHDLESLWWIAVYFLMTRVVLEDAANPQCDVTDHALQEQFDSVERLFLEGSRRHIVMVTDSAFMSDLRTLHTSLHEPGLLLEDAREILVKAFHYLEEDIDSREFSVPQETYDGLQTILRQIAEIFSSRTVEYGDILHDPAVDSTSSVSVA